MHSGMLFAHVLRVGLQEVGVTLWLLQLEDKLQMICDKQVTVIEHMEGKMQHLSLIHI